MYSLTINGPGALCRYLLAFIALTYSFTSKAQINLSWPVGSVAGRADVSPAGSSAYSIPIDLPDGVNHLTPTLSLSYNSLGGDGLYGWGWTLEGASMISRSGRTVFQNGQATPVNYTNTNDVFTLDGNRLTAISGLNGENGTVYAAESENYDKIESFGGTAATGPTSFKVTTKEGKILEYGTGVNCVVQGNGTIATTVNVGWLLYKISDASGNYITYSYLKSQNAYLLNTIKYSSNSTVGNSALHSISFSWDSRTDKTTSYDAGVATAIPYRLLNIRVSVTAPAAATVKEYAFAYTTVQGQSFLQSVTEGGLGGITASNKLNPTTFRYGVASAATPMYVTAPYNFLNNQDCISGDFNGDGKSDVLKASYSYDANNVKYHTGYDIYSDFSGVGISFIYSYTLPASTEILPATKLTAQYNFLSNDFDGDGKDDVVMLNSSAEASTQKRIFNKVSINYSRFYSPVAGFSYKTTDYAQVPFSTPYNQYCKYIFQGGNYYIPGDFDGDGNQDYILVLGINSTNGFKAFFNSPKTGVVNAEIASFGAGTNTFGVDFYATTIANANNIVPIDFNGDGKTELLVTKGTSSYIVSVFPVSASSGSLYASSVLYSTTEIASGYRVYPGDFNGDGKTDLLVRNSASTSSAVWKIYYSNGIAYITPTANVPFAYTVILPKDASYTQAHHLMVTDLNGDGKSDILHLLDLSGSSTRYAAYYSTGDGTFLSETNTAAVATNGETELPGDFNSDGKSDCMTITGIKGQVVHVYPFKQERLMASTINGLGDSTAFTYALMTDNNALSYQRSVTYAYDNVNTLSSNHIYYTVPKLPNYLITTISRDNGINGSNTISYQYTDAVYHKGGRGFLGFKKIITYDYATQYVSTTENDINTQFLVPYITKQTVTYNNQVMTENQFTSTFVPLGSSINKRYFLRGDRVLSLNNIAGNASETNNTFDNYGNITSQVTKNGYFSGSTYYTVETNTVNTTFGIHNTPVPALADNITTIYLRNGQSQISQTKAITYNTNGTVATATDFSGQPKAVTTTLTYDVFGNITQSVLSSAGLSSRTLKYTYDIYGLNITKNEMFEAGVSRAETFTYHPSLNKVSTKISFDGLSTTYGYDNYGRRNGVTTPEGYVITNLMQWETQDGRYSTLSQQAGGGPNVKIWYDVLGRETKRQTLGYNSQWLTQSKVYDAKGNVTGLTSPYYATETPVTISTTYDGYNRITYSGNATRSVIMSYSTPGNGLYKTTSTISGKSTTTTKDAAGRTVSATDNGGELLYTFDSRGNITQIQYGSNIVNAKTYDEYGRQLSMTDKDAGTVQYETNAFGELTKQTDNKGNIYTMAYDNLGRISSRTGSDGTTTYTYFRDAATGYANDKPLKITAASGVVYDYEYDAYRRIKTTKATIDGYAFPTQYTYNTYGDLLTTTYPSGIIVSNTVDRNGTLTGISAGPNGNLSTIFTNQGMNSLGVSTSHTLGNAKSSLLTYNMAIGAPTRLFTAGIQDLNLSYDGQTGNLTGRNDVIQGKNETFTYDYLDRLTNTTINNTAVSETQYDGNSGSSMGNIVSKTDAGNYVYSSSKIHAVNYILNPAGPQTPPSVISTNQQDLTYTPFLKTATVSQNNNEWSFVYDHDYQRIRSVFKQNNTELERRYYLGNYEKQFVGSVTREIHYVKNNNGLCAILVKDGATFTPYFVYTDQLGSIVSVTNSAGTVVASQNFDAWGRQRNPTDWSYANLPTQPGWLYRGFTSHEYIPQSALVNMNGRMYDPVIGRMLSPDNFAQAPYSTQSFNRYSYTINNPLKYTDPSGDLFGGTIITGVVDFFTTILAKGGLEFWNKGNFNNAWKEFDPTRPGSRTNNAFKIDAGLFKTDDNRTFAGRAWQIVSRTTWEYSQQELGAVYSHSRNILGNVHEVGYSNGATFVNYNNDHKKNWGATLGSYINGQNIHADMYFDLSKHEFGHTLQSSILGPLYLAAVAVPSLYGSVNEKAGHNDHREEWNEANANNLSYKYFKKFEPERFDLNSPDGHGWDYENFPMNYKYVWFIFIYPPGALISNEE